MEFMRLMSHDHEFIKDWVESAGRPELEEIYAEILANEWENAKTDEVVEVLLQGVKALSDYSNSELRQIVADNMGVTLG